MFPPHDDRVRSRAAGALERAARQEDHIELIASENYASPRVLAAQGSVLTNKYAEGYPGKRYYGGCEHVDVAEQLAIERAKKLFGAAYANVQPHSGIAGEPRGLSRAAQARRHAARHAPRARRPPHARREGNFSGKLFDVAFYGLDADTARSTTTQVAPLARARKPTLIVAGFSAYSRVIDWERFRAIADDVGALSPRRHRARRRPDRGRPLSEPGAASRTS